MKKLIGEFNKNNCACRQRANQVMAQTRPTKISAKHNFLILRVATQRSRHPSWLFKMQKVHSTVFYNALMLIWSSFDELLLPWSIENVHKHSLLNNFLFMALNVWQKHIVNCPRQIALTFVNKIKYNNPNLHKKEVCLHWKEWQWLNLNSQGTGAMTLDCRWFVIKMLFVHWMAQPFSEFTTEYLTPYLVPRYLRFFPRLNVILDIRTGDVFTLSQFSFLSVAQFWVITSCCVIIGNQ